MAAQPGLCRTLSETQKTGFLITAVLLYCLFNYRQATDAKSEIHLPSDVLERLSTHRSHHSTISSQYPVARVVGDDEKDFVLF